MTLHWTAPTDNGPAITSYQIESNPPCSSPCTVTMTGGNTGTEATVTWLDPGESYTFYISATNSVGTGPAAQVTVGVPATGPAAPTQVEASPGPDGTPGDGQVDVSWSAPLNDYGSSVTGYTVAVNPSCTSCTGLVGITGMSTVVAGLQPGSPYNFTVTASNAAGPGDPSQQVQESASATAPNAPSNVAATTPSAGTITVRWVAPAINGSDLTGYTVTPDPACASCIGLSDIAGDATETTVSGLELGQSYTFTVAATNGVGTGPSGISNSEPAGAEAPGVPATVTASAGPVSTPGDGEVDLTWIAPVDNGSQIIGYSISVSPGCSGCLGLEPTTNTTSISGLVPGDSYTFSVAARNGAGIGGSRMSAAITPYTVASAPRSVAAKASPVGAVDVTFIGPAIPGGLPTTSYQIVVSPACPRCGGTTTTTTSASVTGLSHGDRYTFSVRAVNRAGVGLVSSGSAPVLVNIEDGYWLAARNGAVFGFGSSATLGNARTTSSDPVIGIASSADGKGYFVATINGTIDAFGDVRSYGDLPTEHISRTDIVAVVATDNAKGYWLVGSDGEVYAFGDAPFHGDLLSLAHPVHVTDVVGMVACAGDTGYLLVGSDGGVFAFGKTHYYGSLPGLGVRVHDIKGILPSPTNTGYILVGADGGAFVFGHGVAYYGSLPGRHISVSDIVGLAITPDGAGYYMAGSNGTVYGFGDALVYKSPPSLKANLPIAAIAGV